MLWVVSVRESWIMGEFSDVIDKMEDDGWSVGGGGAGSKQAGGGRDNQEEGIGGCRHVRLHQELGNKEHHLV